MTELPKVDASCPGHDAKLKKALVQAALEGSKRAEAKLERLGWTKFLDVKRARAVIGEPARAVTERPHDDAPVRKRKRRSEVASTLEGETASAEPEMVAPSEAVERN